MTYTYSITPENNYIEPYPLSDTFRQEELVVRVYVLRGKQIVPKDDDGLADPWLSLSCGTYEIDDEESLRHDTLAPLFYRVYIFTIVLPAKDSKLKISCYDRDVEKDNELIGSTQIELADRWYSEEWQNMEFKPIELRPLFHPKSRIGQGNLEMWIDIMTTDQARNTPVENIQPPQPKTWQLRAIVWNVDDVPIVETRDFFVSGRLGDHKIQNTDVHYRSKDGKGQFNWRMIWDIIIPSKHDSRLTIQVWDKNFVTPDSALAECTLNLKDFFRKAEKTNDDFACVEIEKQFVSMSLPYKDGVQGAVEISIELMTQEYSLAHPIGKGRDGLPDVIRPSKPWDLLNKFKKFNFKGKLKIYIAIAVVVIVIILILALVIAFAF